MVSPEVYQATLEEFGYKFWIVILMILGLQLLLLLGALGRPRSLPRWHLKALLGSQILQWGLLAAVFYPFYFSEITWYWPWAVGICSAQVLLLLVLIKSKVQCIEDFGVRIKFGLTIYCLILAILVYRFSEFTSALLVFGPIQAALMGMLLASVIKPLMLRFVLAIIPLLVVGHGLLLMLGR